MIFGLILQNHMSNIIVLSRLLLQPVALGSAELVQLLVCMYIKVISELYVAVLSSARVCTVHHYGIIMSLKVYCGSCHVHQPHLLSIVLHSPFILPLL